MSTFGGCTYVAQGQTSVTSGVATAISALANAGMSGLCVSSLCLVLLVLLLTVKSLKDPNSAVCRCESVE